MDKKKSEYKRLTDAVKELIKPDRINSFEWPKEMKIMRVLFKRFPEIEFWETLNLGFKINTLAFFRSGEGKIRLLAAFKAWQSKSDFRPSEEYSNEKIGESRQVLKKLNNLLAL